MNAKTLLRVGALLALSFLGIGAACAADEPASDGPAAMSLKKDALCTRCHDESETKPILSIYQTRHGVKADERTPNCQSCHGESKNHLAGGQGVGNASRPAPDVVFKTNTTVNAASDSKLQEDTCIACHKGGKRMNWDGSQHETRGIACGTCHQVHVKRDPVLGKTTQPEVCFACHKTQRAQTHRFSTHPLAAGKMACSDCHNPHGSTGPTLLVKNSVNETCYQCHAEKRGPFLWEHSPVVDDCTNCHTPHGSTNPTLLKTRVPQLCQECHSGDHAAQLNSGANLANGNLTTDNGALPLASISPRSQLVGRACLNCHSQIHGSNNPAGAKFHR